MKMLRGLKTFYIFDNGGYVKKAKLANPGKENRWVKKHLEETNELGAAMKAAQSGYEVFFIPHIEINGISNPDVFINNDIADIKHIFTPTENAIIKAMKRARKQGVSTILLEIVTTNLSLDFVEPIVKKQLGNHIKNALVSIGGKVYPIKK
jgi:hypothetical protein